MKEYFVEWPLPIDKIEYSIHVVLSDGRWPKFPSGLTPDNKISYVEFYKGEIDYNIKINKKTPLKMIHSETLEEAMAILKDEGWNAPHNDTIDR